MLGDTPVDVAASCTRPNRRGGRSTVWRRFVPQMAGGLLVAVLSATAVLARLGAVQQRAGCPEELGALERSVSANADDLFAGADYRQAAIRCEAFDRSIEFFKRLSKAHRGSLHVRLNLALAYVDKLPTSGDMRQALLGRDATAEFERANAIQPTWLAHYSRGFIYLNYPRPFRLGRKAIGELRRAIALEGGQPRPYHAKAWVALGDAHYWRLSELDKAREVWAEGLVRFPGDAALQERTSTKGMALRDAIRRTMNPDVRMDTSLSEFR